MGRITEITKKQAIPRLVERATKAIANGAETLFIVTGNIIVTDIVGEVTTLLETKTTAIKLVANATVGADVDMCATVDATAAAVGSTFAITGTLANAMVKTAGGAGLAQAARQVVHDGVIALNSGAANTGCIKWTLHYIPVDATSTVVAA